MIRQQLRRRTSAHSRILPQGSEQIQAADTHVFQLPALRSAIQFYYSRTVCTRQRIVFFIRNVIKYSPSVFCLIALEE